MHTQYVIEGQGQAICRRAFVCTFVLCVIVQLIAESVFIRGISGSLLHSVPLLLSHSHSDGECPEHGSSSFTSLCCSMPLAVFSNNRSSEIYFMSLGHEE